MAGERGRGRASSSRAGALSHRRISLSAMRRRRLQLADDANTQHATRSTQAWQWRLLDDNANEWEWGNRARRRHDLSSWLPVEVPVSVQEALWRAGRIPHPYLDLNSHAAEWVEHRDWVYGCDFVLPPPPGRRVFLE